MRESFCSQSRPLELFPLEHQSCSRIWTTRILTVENIFTCGDPPRKDDQFGRPTQRPRIASQTQTLHRLISWSLPSDAFARSSLPRGQHLWRFEPRPLRMRGESISAGRPCASPWSHATRPGRRLQPKRGGFGGSQEFGGSAVR